MAGSVVLAIVMLLLTIVGQVRAQDTPRVRRPPNSPSISDPNLRNPDSDSEELSSIDFELDPKAAKRAKITNQEKEEFKTERRNGFKLLKMYNAPDCVDRRVVNIGDQRCASNYDLLPVGFYSFFYTAHGEDRSDLRIKEGYMYAGSGLFRQGMLIDLGALDPNTMSATSPEAVSLSNFEIASKLGDAEKQRLGLELGIECGEMTVASRLKLVQGHVYLLRAVSYKHSERMRLPYSYDNVIVLSIGRITDDNMVLILWRKLSDKKAPQLKVDDKDDEKDVN